MAALALGLLLILAALGIYVAAILGILAIFLGETFSFIPLLPALGDITWSASTEFILTRYDERIKYEHSLK